MRTVTGGKYILQRPKAAAAPPGPSLPAQSPKSSRPGPGGCGRRPPSLTVTGAEGLHDDHEGAPGSQSVLDGGGASAVGMVGAAYLAHALHD